MLPKSFFQWYNASNHKQSYSLHSNFNQG
jgi:hypothetical protein